MDKMTYLGIGIGQQVTTKQPQLAQLSGVDGTPISIFTPDAVGKVVNICRWVSKTPETPGRFFFVVEYQDGDASRRVSLNSVQIKAAKPH